MNNTNLALGIAGKLRKQSAVELAYIRLRPTSLANGVDLQSPLAQLTLTARKMLN